jgi:hypothetical protein
VHTSIVRTFILQFYLNTLFVNEIGECYLQSIVREQYFSIIFNEKKGALYSTKYNISLILRLNKPSRMFVNTKESLMTGIEHF